MHSKMASRAESVLSTDIAEALADYAVDLLCAGFPCQPVSIAGARLAGNDQRWLWPDVLRCIRLLRPRFVLIENVPGLFTAGFGDVLSGLAASGYDAEWDCVPTGILYGHKRERLLLVAYPAGTRLERRLFSEAAWQAFAELARQVGRAPTPRILRRADGLPCRMERMTALGNAVVVDIAEWIGKQIMKVQA